jgi:hypothetical protein
VLFGFNRVPFNWSFSPCSLRDCAIRHRTIMRMMISTQNILPMQIPAIAAALRVLFETDGCDVGDTSALVVVIALKVVERALVAVVRVAISPHVRGAASISEAIVNTYGVVPQTYPAVFPSSARQTGLLSLVSPTGICIEIELFVDTGLRASC